MPATRWGRFWPGDDAEELVDGQMIAIGKLRIRVERPIPFETA